MCKKVKSSNTTTSQTITDIKVGAVVEVFEVMCDQEINEQYAGRSIFYCRELDDAGDTISNTEFVLDDAGNIVTSNTRKVLNTDEHLSYRHSKLIGITGDHFELKDMPYTCSPLPSRSSDWLVLRHPDGKDWAARQDKKGGVSAVFRNDHTNGRWIHTELAVRPSLRDRIKEKKDKGYVETYAVLKTWKSAARSFS